MLCGVFIWYEKGVVKMEGEGMYKWKDRNFENEKQCIYYMYLYVNLKTRKQNIYYICFVYIDHCSAFVEKK